MPSYTACPLCNKDGLSINAGEKLTNCPVCKNSHQFGVPPEVSRNGFTTKERYNAYQRKMANISCKPVIDRACEIFKDNNPDFTNQKLKKFRKEQTDKLLTSLLQTKFALIQ